MHSAFLLTLLALSALMCIVFGVKAFRAGRRAWRVFTLNRKH